VPYYECDLDKSISTGKMIVKEKMKFSDLHDHRFNFLTAHILMSLQPVFASMISDSECSILSDFISELTPNELCRAYTSRGSSGFVLPNIGENGLGLHVIGQLKSKSRNVSLENLPVVFDPTFVFNKYVKEKRVCWKDLSLSFSENLEDIDFKRVMSYPIMKHMGPMEKVVESLIEMMEDDDSKKSLRDTFKGRMKMIPMGSADRAFICYRIMVIASILPWHSGLLKNTGKVPKATEVILQSPYQWSSIKFKNDKSCVTETDLSILHFFYPSRDTSLMACLRAIREGNYTLRDLETEGIKLYEKLFFRSVKISSVPALNAVIHNNAIQFSERDVGFLG